MAQDALMLVDPATGQPKPYPSHAAQWRAFNGGKLAWLYNPWTCKARSAADVGTDPFGLSCLSSLATAGLSIQGGQWPLPAAGQPDPYMQKIRGSLAKQQLAEQQQQALGGLMEQYGRRQDDLDGGLHSAAIVAQQARAAISAEPTERMKAWAACECKPTLNNPMGICICGPGHSQV